MFHVIFSCLVEANVRVHLCGCVPVDAVSLFKDTFLKGPYPMALARKYIIVGESLFDKMVNVGLYSQVFRSFLYSVNIIWIDVGRINVKG
jgi:hypothetical protein